jgi:hypothetical protein
MLANVLVSKNLKEFPSLLTLPPEAVLKVRSYKKIKKRMLTNVLVSKSLKKSLFF